MELRALALNEYVSPGRERCLPTSQLKGVIRWRLVFSCIDVMLRSFVTSIFLYACESWTFTAELRRRTQAMEMRCYRNIIHISYKDHVTNEEVRAKIQQAIGPHEDLLTIAKRSKRQ